MMNVKLPRRTFLHLAVGAAALPALSRIARAQTYPQRPVRLIVGFTPGGTTDIVARLVGQRLSERMGQPFIIENRPGAAGNLGTEAVVTAPPDGHTLLVVTTANAINAALYYKLNFNFIRDVASVAGFGDAKSFRAQYARLTDGQFDELKARLQPICHRTLRRQVLEYIRYTNRIPITREFVPSEAEQSLYDMVSDYLRRPSLQALPSSQR